MEHSVILSTFIKLPFSIKTFVLSIFKWPPKTGFSQMHARIQRGSRHPPENHKAIGYLSNTRLDPLESYKATKPAFNVVPLSVHQ